MEFHLSFLLCATKISREEMFNHWRYEEEIGWYSSYFRYFGLERNFDRNVVQIDSTMGKNNRNWSIFLLLF